MHCAGVTHCVLPLQVVRQSLPVPQTNGAHGSDVPAMQVPAPSQVDDSRCVELVQLLAAHSVSCA